LQQGADARDHHAGPHAGFPGARAGWDRRRGYGAGIGAYDRLIATYARPERVWEMHTAAGGRQLLPMHHSKFEVSDEMEDEPLRRLMAVAWSRSPSIVATRLGEM